MKQIKADVSNVRIFQIDESVNLEVGHSGRANESEADIRWSLGWVKILDTGMSTPRVYELFGGPEWMSWRPSNGEPHGILFYETACSLIEEICTSEEGGSEPRPLLDHLSDTLGGEWSELARLAGENFTVIGAPSLA